MGIAFTLNNILPEVCQAVHAVWSCIYILLISVYHHSFRNFNNECSTMSVSIGFNDDGKNTVYSLRNFNTKILNVRVCSVSVLVS